MTDEERIKEKLDVMRYEAQALACSHDVPVRISVLVFARHIAALEVAAEKAAE